MALSKVRSFLIALAPLFGLLCAAISSAIPFLYGQSGEYVYGVLYFPLVAGFLWVLCPSLLAGNDAVAVAQKMFRVGFRLAILVSLFMLPGALILAFFTSKPTQLFERTASALIPLGSLTLATVGGLMARWLVAMGTRKSPNKT
jgi:hypothetical protein